MMHAIPTSRQETPGTLRLHGDEAAALLERGVELHRAGKLDEAKQAYLALLREDGRNADAWHLLGVIAHQLGGSHAAVKLISKAIELDPNRALFYNNLANALVVEQRIDDAEALYRHAIALQPDYPDPIYNLGTVHELRGRRNQALDCYEKAIALRPDYLDALCATARMHQGNGNFEQAALLFEQALELDSDHAQCNLQLGHLRFLQGRLQSALEHYQRYKRRVSLPGKPMSGLPQILPLMSAKSWCERSAARYVALACAARQRVVEPRFENGPPIATPASHGTVNEIYLAQLSQATAIGWHDVVLVDDDHVALYDMAARGLHADIEVEHGVARYVSSTHLLLDCGSASSPPIARGVLLAGRGRDSYAHWLIDFLPRLWVLDQFPEYHDWPLLVDHGLYPQQVEALQRLNRPRRPLIVLESDTAYRVNQLVLVSDLSCMRQQSYRLFTQPTAAEAVISPHAVSYLRRAFVPEETQRDVGRLLYVSRRRQSQFRRLTNEPEVEQVFTGFGFDIVYPEMLPHAEQVRLFSEAAVVAGPAGSNMINTVFSPRGAAILMLAQRNPGVNYYFFSQLAALCGQRLSYLLGGIVNPHAYHYQSDFRIDPAELAQAVQQILEQPR